MRVTAVQQLIWKINGVENRYMDWLKNADLEGCFEELKFLTCVDLGRSPKKWKDMLEKLGPFAQDWRTWAKENPEYMVKD